MFNIGDTIKVVSVKSWDSFKEFKNFKSFVSDRIFCGDLTLKSPPGIIISIILSEEFSHCRNVLTEKSIF